MCVSSYNDQDNIDDSSSSYLVYRLDNFSCRVLEIKTV